MTRGESLHTSRTKTCQRASGVREELAEIGLRAHRRSCSGCSCKRFRTGPLR